MGMKRRLGEWVSSDGPPDHGSRNTRTYAQSVRYRTRHVNRDVPNGGRKTGKGRHGSLHSTIPIHPHALSWWRLPMLSVDEVVDHREHRGHGEAQRRESGRAVADSAGIGR